MKYSAHYKLTDSLKASVLAAAQDVCSTDRYYPRHDSRFGVSIHGKVPANWQELEALATGNMVEDHRQWLRWKTCGGNTEGIIISGDVVVYIREGRRHGIPNFFREIFEFLVPIWGTENYITQRPDVSPFETDV